MLRRIASDFNISAKGVRKIIKRLKNNGTAENLPRSGPSKKNFSTTGSYDKKKK